MQRLQVHVRNAFLAGLFAVTPLVITLVVLWWINDKSKLITEWLFGRSIPFLGAIIAIAAVYVVGVLVSSLLGKVFLNLLDKLLGRVPILRDIYSAWKQILLTPGGTDGIYSKVWLIPDESGTLRLLGFSRSVPVENNPNLYCVYVPSAPNPITGKLYFVKRDQMQPLDISTEEAFKFILSSGNYVPPQVGAAVPTT